MDSRLCRLNQLHESSLRPGDVLVHESIEAVVEVAARKLKPQQRFEQVWPTQLRAEGDVPGLAVKRDD